MKIVKIDDGKYEIQSDNGIYNIVYAGSGDADPEYIGLWECNCPAARHGRDCKHMRAFLDMLEEEEEEDW